MLSMHCPQHALICKQKDSFAQSSMKLEVTRLRIWCSDQLSPKAVESLRDRRMVAISGGWRHTAAADDAGNLFTWGWNKASLPFFVAAQEALLSRDSPPIEGRLAHREFL